jgi:hypothetical protein
MLVVWLVSGPQIARERIASAAKRESLNRS